MGFSKSLLAGLALIASTLAQSMVPVAFTSVPAVVVAGSSYNITWGGGNGDPVTLTLRKGDPDNLDTIGILAEGVTGDWYKWNVSDSLESATDYALQITQGQDSINYSGLFSITSENSTSTATTATSSSNSTMTTSGTRLPTGAGGNSTITGGMNATTTSSYTGRTITTTPATSAHTATAATSTPASTSAPDSNAAVQYGSSAAFVMGIFGAVVFLS